MHLPPIDRGQMRLGGAYPRGLFEKAAAETQRLDPETAVSCLTALGNHGQLDPAACLISLRLAIPTCCRLQEHREHRKCAAVHGMTGPFGHGREVDAQLSSPMKANGKLCSSSPWSNEKLLFHGSQLSSQRLGMPTCACPEKDCDVCMQQTYKARVLGTPFNLPNGEVRPTCSLGSRSCCRPFLSTSAAISGPEPKVRSWTVAWTAATSADPAHILGWLSL